MSNTLEIMIPKGMMNIGITSDNYLIADTNDSSNWIEFKQELPNGKWSIGSVKNNILTLYNLTKLENRNWFERLFNIDM